MSEIAKQLFDSLKSVGANALSEMGAESSRLVTQGANELASSLFTGGAFVQYGAGQYLPDLQPEQTPARQHEQGLEI